MPEEYFAINHSMSRRTPSTMDSAGILADVVALNGAKGTITLGIGTWLIDLATVIPANARLVVEQGAMLTKSGSGTLTINGPFEAPLAQVFSGFAAGEIVFSRNSILKPQWFGALADGVYSGSAWNGTDDHTALQLAIDVAQDTGAPVDIGWGRYLTSQALVIGASPLRIFGAGYSRVSIIATSSMAALLGFTDASDASDLDAQNFEIDGNGLAQYGLKSDRINNAHVERLQVRGTSVAGIQLGYGWDNDIIRCRVYYNAGDGIVLSQNNNNGVNIHGCKIFNNAGWGLVSGSGTAQSVLGNTFEANRKGGVHITGGVSGAVIQGNYFESNAQDGFTVSNVNSQAVTPYVLHSDILVNGAGRGDGYLGRPYPTQGAIIEGNYFNSPYSSHGCIYACSAPSLAVRGNVGLSGQAAYLLGATMLVSPASGLKEFNNQGFTSKMNLDSSNVNYTMSGVDDWEFDGLPKRNYFNASASAFTLQVNNGNPITATKSASRFNGEDVIEFSAAAGGTDYWGQVIYLANFPELAGNIAVFSAWVKTESASADVNQYVSGAGSRTDSISGGSDAWHKVAQLVNLPASGNIQFTFWKFGSPSSKAYISKPVLTLLGVPGDTFYKEFSSGGSTAKWLGTFASAPASWDGGVEGATYRNSGDGKVYLHIGSGWEALT